MTSRIILVISIFIAFSLASCTSNAKDNNKASAPKKYVVVLSMDGFRWDYTEGLPTPNFDKMAQLGVKAESMQSSFPSKTFPNHYTIATGLYPDHHGLVNNTFYMPDRNEVYKIRNREKVEDGSIYSGEPIWISAEKQDVKTASYFWVGSEADIQGIQPSIWKNYHQRTPFEDRADSVISWLQLPMQNRPQLIMWYVHQPDGVGHRFGPNSTILDSTVVALDALLGRFMNQLSELNNADSINFILLSDHGMGYVNSEKSIAITDYLEKDWEYDIYGYNPMYNIWAEGAIKDSIFNRLKDIEHIQCYKTDNVPAHLHYDSSKRRGDLIVMADSAWSVFEKPKNAKKKEGGTHGYDSNNKDMDAIFYAYGPDFKVNYTMKRFQNIHIYELLAHLLDIQPAENDGDIDHIREMLNVKVQ